MIFPVRFKNTAIALIWTVWQKKVELPEGTRSQQGCTRGQHPETRSQNPKTRWQNPGTRGKRLPIKKAPILGLFNSFL